MNRGGSSDKQLGFIPGKTTIDAIETIIRIVKDTRDKGEYCTIIALDIAGAFDKAWCLGY